MIFDSRVTVLEEHRRYKPYMSGCDGGVTVLEERLLN
jgi:hypothetical protein